MRIFIGTLLALFSLGAFLIIGGISVFVFSIYVFSKDLPEYGQLSDYNPPVTTRVYAGDGTLISEYAVERRVFVPNEAIPRLVKQAFLSAEDKNFYSHKGVDFAAIVRAATTNIQNFGSGRRPVGASTITQQVAKNFLLTNELSYERKIKEAILSFRLEQAFSKDRLLELYLNEIYLGGGTYGVASAALHYFNKSLDELSVAEAAFLAALPKAPNNYNPRRHYQAAFDRRNWVIERMRVDGHITRAQADIAAATPILLNQQNNEPFYIAEYFTEEIRRVLQRRYGSDGLYGGGLLVRSTLDPRLQKIAYESLRDGLETYDRRKGYKGPMGHMASVQNWQEEIAAYELPDGAGLDWEIGVVLSARDGEAEVGFQSGEKGSLPLRNVGWARQRLRGGSLGPAVGSVRQILRVGDVIMAVRHAEDNKKETDRIYRLRQIPDVQGGIVALDPHTGRILAMHGGYSPKISEFNRVTQAMRQPGSAFKPFIYLAALDEGFTPSNLILDGPIVIDQGPGLPQWRPTNYTNEFYGPTPIRVGIEKSRNLMTVRLANHIGMEKVRDYAKKFGIVDEMPLYLSYALGAKETTLLRLTAAYAVFVSGGKEVRPSMIDRIQDRKGKTIYKQDNRPCKDCGDLIGWQEQRPPSIPDMRQQIADPRTSYQMVSMLEGVIQRGTAMAMRDLNRPMAGKTGTTNSYKDAWFIGFSPDLVVGVFVGFDGPRSLGSKESGSRVAVPIFKNFMEQALKDEPIVPFRVPQGVRMVQVNPETGQPAAAGDRRAIWEAFLPGTEPARQQYILDQEGLAPIEGISGRAARDSAVIGTGGLY